MQLLSIIAGELPEPSIGENDEEMHEDILKEGTQTADEEGYGYTLVALDSAKSDWQENIELNWVKVQVRDDLLAVRDFLKEGINLAVMEEKVIHVWWAWSSISLLMHNLQHD